jgi:hypothetical protein
MRSAPTLLLPNPLKIRFDGSRSLAGQIDRDPD